MVTLVVAPVCVDKPGLAQSHPYARDAPVPLFRRSRPRNFSQPCIFWPGNPFCMLLVIPCSFVTRSFLPSSLQSYRPSPLPFSLFFLSNPPPPNVNRVSTAETSFFFFDSPLLPPFVFLELQTRPPCLFVDFLSIGFCVLRIPV